MQRSGIPLRVRLSVGSAVRLSLAIAAFGAIAYQTSKRSALDAAAGRARAAAYSLAQRSSLGLADILRPLTEAAADPAVVAALRSGVPSPEARATLGRLPRDSAQTVAVGIRSRSGKVILSLDRELPPLAFDESLPVDSARFGRAIARGDSILYESVAPVFDGPQVIGSVVRVRRLATSPAALRSVSDLMGTGGVLLVRQR